MPYSRQIPCVVVDELEIRERNPLLDVSAVGKVVWPYFESDDLHSHSRELDRIPALEAAKIREPLAVKPVWKDNSQKTFCREKRLAFGNERRIRLGKSSHRRV